MVCAPPLIGKVPGHTLVMVGLVLLTVRFTVMLCALAPAPDAVTVIFPTYAAVCCARLDASTETVAVYVATARLVGWARKLRLPGSLPVSGPTVNQRMFVPETAVVNAGVPAFVFTETVCAAGSAAPI